MIRDPEPVGSELRSLPGIKDVNVVQFPTKEEPWIVLREPVDLDRLRQEFREPWLRELPQRLSGVDTEGETRQIEAGLTRHKIGHKLREVTAFANLALGV